jgi:hypothetical protein
MLTVAKFPHAQASCAMLLDEEHCKATWVSLFTTSISFCWFVTYAENVRMSYKGVKLNPFEVLITGWRCSVWFLKPFQLFFFFEAVNVYRKQESYVDFRHLTTYTQCKPNLLNLSHTNQ